MPVYEVAGLRIGAPFSIAELVEVPGPPDWTVVQGTVEAPAAADRIYELRTPDDVLWATIGAGDGRFTLTFDGEVGFAVDTATRAVTYAPRAGLPENTLRHLLVDQVIPRLLAIGGRLVLHASAVAIDGEAVAFIGPSGMGKSSLAAGYVQHGAALLADDFLLLHPAGAGYEATAAYPGLRLWEDSAAFFAGPVGSLPAVAGYTEKRRWATPLGADAGGRLPLRAIVMLGNRPGPDAPVVRIGRLRGADAFMMLFQQAFRVDRSDRADQQAELERITRLAEAVPVLLIEHRRDYAVLPEVLGALDRALASLPR